jgi:hypothetical protein
MYLLTYLSIKNHKLRNSVEKAGKFKHSNFLHHYQLAKSLPSGIFHTVILDKGIKANSCLLITDKPAILCNSILDLEPLIKQILHTRSLRL